MAPWTCSVCQIEHDELVSSCPTCSAGAVTAPTDSANGGGVAPHRGGKLTECENCYHKHHDGVHCHVFIESSISLESVAADDDDDFDDGFIEEAPAEGGGAKKDDKRPLGTPMFVKRVRYVRCNCTVGVPAGNARFKPLPAELICRGSDIRIMTYDMVLAGAAIPKDRTAKAIAAERVELLNRIGDLLPYVGQFVKLGHVSHLANTCRRWAAGANNFPEYVDVRNFVPWQMIKAHTSQVRGGNVSHLQRYDQCCAVRVQVDSAISVGDKVYSGGDKRIMVSDMNSGVVLHQVTRDTGSIPLLDKFENSLICCSASGAMRFFGLSFNVKRMKLVKSLCLAVHTVLTYALCAGTHHVGALAAHHAGTNGIPHSGALRNARDRRSCMPNVHSVGR